MQVTTQIFVVDDSGNLYTLNGGRESLEQLG